jgi:predicted tellurium resistance membrane protein TerC
MDVSFLLEPGTWLALLSLTAMLLILDIDNIVFVSILASNLTAAEQRRLRRLNLVISFLSRGLLLLGVGYLANLKEPLLTVMDYDLTAQDLIVLSGGLFLMYKSTTEIHNKLEGPDPETPVAKAVFGQVLVSVAVLNLVFSLDSVITAVGMTRSVPLMLVAIAISLFIIFLFQGRIAAFVQRHPTTKVLALSFLLLIGGFLVVEALHVHIPKGYIYFAMAFSLGIELLNLRVRQQGTPVQLHGPLSAQDPTAN